MRSLILAVGIVLLVAIPALYFVTQALGAAASIIR
jgi:hypothetical protein